MALRVSHWLPTDDDDVIESTVGDLLRRAAALAPDQIALVAREQDASRRTWTYAELLEEAERVARALLARFEPGEHVAIWAPNRFEWVLMEYGAALAGVVLVTVNPALLGGEVEYVLGQSKAAGVFLVDAHRSNPMLASLERVRGSLPHLREVVRFDDWDAFLAGGRETMPLPEVSPDAPAQVQYTSGTTGFPKGALLRHVSIVNNARFMGARLGVEQGDTVLNYMPLFHTGGCVCGTLIPAAFLGTQVLLSGFTPAYALEAAEAECCSVIGGVTTMYIMMMEDPSFAERDLSALRVGWTGGSTVPAALVRRIESSFGIRLSIVFGQTETSPTITQTRLDDDDADKSGTVGQPLPRTEVKIVDPDTGETLPVGRPGELCTRGYLTMQGYFDMPEATAATIDEDGWLHTGDQCAMDERGFVTVTGRIKDMIKRGGENLYPREIESALMEHPAVVDVAVVGVSDPVWVEQPAAFVRLGGDASEQELVGFLRERLAPHKTPRIWRFVDEFPTTPSGKVQKYLLRAQLEEEAAGAES